MTQRRYCNSYYVLGDFHKSHLFFQSLCIRAIRVFRGLRSVMHIDALVLIPSTGFKENFLRFSDPTADDRIKRVRRLRRLESLAVAPRPLQAQIQIRKAGTQERNATIELRIAGLPEEALYPNSQFETRSAPPFAPLPSSSETTNAKWC
jgi:hypothetical protein